MEHLKTYNKTFKSNNKTVTVSNHSGVDQIKHILKIWKRDICKFSFMPLESKSAPSPTHAPLTCQLK